MKRFPLIMFSLPFAVFVFTHGIWSGVFIQQSYLLDLSCAFCMGLWFSPILLDLFSERGAA